MNASPPVGRLRRVWAWLRTATSSALYIEGDVLVERSGRREVRLPLREVSHVRSDWIPYRGGVLYVCGRGRRVTITVDETTAELRREIGRQVVKNGPSVVESSSIRRELGLG